MWDAPAGGSPLPIGQHLTNLRSKGGRIEVEQATLAKMLRLSRIAVNAALRDLDLALLVKKQRAGVYQLNAMLAGYLSPEDVIAAVKAMPKDERLNAPGFVERYRKAVEAYQEVGGAHGAEPRTFTP